MDWNSAFSKTSKEKPHSAHLNDLIGLLAMQTGRSLAAAMAIMLP